MTFEEVCNTFGDKLVFVASQQLRTKFLLMTKGQYLPSLHRDLSLHGFCILERIGRCRQYGCLDISKESIKLAPKEIFYHRNKILRSKWITRQFISKRKKKGIMRYSLYFLKRYHVEHQSKLTSIMQSVLESLKSASLTNYMLPIKSFGDVLGTVTSLSVKKLLNFFQLDDIVKELDLPYSEVYPHLSKSQCLNASKKEKLATCIQLLDPNINIEKELNKDFEDLGDAGSDDDEDEEDAAEELQEEEINESQTQLSLADAFTHVDPVSDLSDDESLASCPDPNRDDTSSSSEEFVEESMQVSFLKKKGFLIEKEIPVDLSIKKQLMKIVEETGPKGCAGYEVKRKLQLNRTDNRNLLKHSTLYLDSFLKDDGRQRRQYIRLKRYKNSDYVYDDVPCKKVKPDLLETAELDAESNVAVNSGDLDTNELTTPDPTDKKAEIKEKQKNIYKFCVSDLQRLRANEVVEYINENKYAVFSQIYNYLLEKDKARNITSKIDRKTVHNLLEKLAAYGCLKVVNLSMKLGLLSQTVKNVRVYAISEFDTESESFREQLRMEQLKLYNPKNALISPKKELNESAIDVDGTYQIKTEAYDTEYEKGYLNDQKDFLPHKEEDFAQVNLKSFENVILEITNIKSTEEPIKELKHLYPTQIMNDRVSDCHEYILQNRVVIGSKHLQKFISERDKIRKYDAVIDTRTIRRMIERMSLNNFINCFLVKFKNMENGSEKELYISTILDISLKHPEITDILAKEKLLFVGQQRVQSSTPKPPKQSGEYTFLSKFSKMEKMHKLAFHMAYSAVKPLENQDLARSNLERNTLFKIPNDHPPIYNDSDLNDFTFLPSLYPPNSYPRGFVSFDDFFSLLPIKILMESIVRDSFSSSLDEYYRDPVRRFYPIKHTDAGIYTVLTRQAEGRKNVSSVVNIFQNIATIGLIQFGKRLGSEKENFLFYVNQKTSLRDTITAAPSYTELDPETMKPATVYHFQDMSDVKKYWLDTSHICINTPLGMRTFSLGQKVKSYKRPCDKPALSECCKHIEDVNVVLSRDIGQIPGDGLGAAGYDSALFAHMKKNWYSSSKTVKTPTVVKPTREVNKLYHLLRDKTKSKIAKIAKGSKDCKVTERTVEKIKKKVKKKKSIKTNITEAARRSFRSQIKWSAADADVLHLTHVLYKLFKLKPCNRLTRDILVKMFNKKVLNKKSKSMNTISAKVLLSHYRRVLKIPENKDRYSLLETEVNHRPEVRNFLCPHITKHRELSFSKDKTEAHRYICDNFLPIVKNVYEMIIVDQQSLNRDDFPSSYDQFVEEYRTVVSTEPLTDLYPVPNTLANMELNILLNLIYSSLASGSYMKNDKMSICLFDAYQRYSESLIHKAVRILRKLQIIASCRFINNLNHGRQLNRTHHPTPLPISRFKFSLRYIIRINPSEMKCNTFHESYVLFKELSQSTDSVHDIPHVDGAYFNVLLTLLDHDVKLDIETPETLLLFDPSLGKTHQHIVDRYNQLVEHYKQGTTFKSVIDNEGEEDLLKMDEEKDETIPPMNLFNAARLAMYTLRDVLIKEHISVQHIHKLLTLNTCKILLSRVPRLLGQYDAHQSEAYIRKISQRVTVPQLTEEQINALLTPGIEKELEQFIESKQEVGATSADIRLKFGATRKVKATLDRLVDKQIIIQTGSILVTYVHNKSCTPWLIKISSHPNGRAMKEITIEPWIHVDGVLNRMVLDYMLSLVLGYVIFNPGVSLLCLQEHFAIVLQPVHIIRLVETLLHFQCVTAQAVTVVRPTLFAEGSVKLSPATLLEPSDLIHVEAMPDAVLKLGAFIGEKSYDADFLTDILNSRSADEEQTNVDSHDGNQEVMRFTSLEDET